MSEEIYYHFLSVKHAFEDLERERIKVAIISNLNDPFELLPDLSSKKTKEERAPYHSLRRKVSKGHRLLCFSKTYEEQLLWSHYADGHKGIAIGFKILKHEPFEVAYVPELGRVKLELTDDSIQNERLYLGLAKIKYKGWEYEHEFRILVPCKDCNEKDRSFLDFKGNLEVIEIILGCKFNRDDKEYMSKLAGKFHIKPIETREAWEGYKINERG